MSQSRPDIDVVLDACIDEIAAGHSTLEQCLDAWPEYRAELSVLLETVFAMRELPRPAEQAPDPARRAEFLTAIRTLPQQAPAPPERGRLDALTAAFTGPARALGTLRPPVRRGAMLAGPALAAFVLVVVFVLSSGSESAHAATATVFAPGVERETDGQWAPLTDGETIEPGDRLRAGSGGRAVLTFRDGSTVTIEPGAELRLLTATFGPTRTIEIEQFAGTLWNDVAPGGHPDSRYRVTTSDAEVIAHGTTFQTSVAADETTVTTASGVVELRAEQQSIFIPPGERAAAQRQRLLSAAAVPVEAAQQLRLAVEGPFTASLIAPTGAATGARPDGTVFNQIVGALTSSPDEGPQRIDLLAPPDGEYTVVVRRADRGAGVVVFEVNGELQRVPLDALDRDTEVRLRVAVRNGEVTVTREQRTNTTSGENPERIIVTDQARERAEAVADALHDRLDQQRRDRDDQRRPLDRDRDGDREAETDRGSDTPPRDRPTILPTRPIQVRPTEEPTRGVDEQRDAGDDDASSDRERDGDVRPRPPPTRTPIPKPDARRPDVDVGAATDRPDDDTPPTNGGDARATDDARSGGDEEDESDLNKDGPSSSSGSSTASISGGDGPARDHPALSDSALSDPARDHPAGNRTGWRGSAACEPGGTNSSGNAANDGEARAALGTLLPSPCCSRLSAETRCLRGQRPVREAPAREAAVR